MNLPTVQRLWLPIVLILHPPSSTDMHRRVRNTCTMEDMYLSNRVVVQW